MVEFRNSEENGLGMPLPAGVVRVYKADSKGSLQFAGEDRIEHTPAEEKLDLHLGNAFDIVGEAVQLNHTDLGKGYEQSYKVTLRNHKKTEDIKVNVVVYVGGDWAITQSNHDYTKKDASTAIFTVPVKADGEAELTYTYRVTWR
jgi:hypothetical protein